MTTTPMTPNDSLNQDKKNNVLSNVFDSNHVTY